MCNSTVWLAALQVERIQNRKLYQHYSGYKSQVQERWAHIPNLDVEKSLWHGSGATDPSLIYTDEYGKPPIVKTAVKADCQSCMAATAD